MSVTYFIGIMNALKNVLGLQIMYLSRDIKLQSISSKKRNDIFVARIIKDRLCQDVSFPLSNILQYSCSSS